MSANDLTEQGSNEAVDKSFIRNLIEHYSVHSKDVQRYQYQIYSEMRESCPVAHSQEHGGFYAISRYDDIYEVAHKPEVFSSFPVTIPPFGNPTPMIPLEADPPYHRNYRALVGRQFSPKSVAQLEPKMRTMVTHLIDSLEGTKKADLAQQLAVPLPLRAILELYLGVPQKDWEWLKDEFIFMLQPDPDATDEENQERAMQAGLNSQMYFAEMLDDLRNNGFGDDLISDLAQAEVEGEQLSDEELLGFCLVLVPAGFDTTASVLSRLMLLLAEQPSVRDELEQIIDDPDKMDIAIEELIRYMPPLPGIARTVKETCEVANTRLEEGDRVFMMWPSANRDPEYFTEPDQLKLDRQPNRHLGFGSGIHRCLGSHLARLELKVFLQEFLRRAPRYEVDPEQGAEWHTGSTWGVKKLPVVFDDWETTKEKAASA